MKEVVAEELCILFVSQPVVDEDQPVAILNKETAHGPGAKVIFVWRICLLPDRFRHYSEHRASIQFKKTGVNDVELHWKLKVLGYKP